MGIDIYEVEERGGRKVIHYNGFLWEGDIEPNDEGIMCSWRREYGKWCGIGGDMYDTIAYVDEIDGSKVSFVVDWLFALCQQYGGLISDQEYEDELVWLKECGTELHMDDVTADTPCGLYWYGN